MAEDIKVPENFDWEYYLENNPDVAKIKAYNSKKGAELHWIKWGKKEGRKYTKEPKIVVEETKPQNTSLSVTIKLNENKSVGKQITIVIPNKLGQTPDLTITSLYKQTFTSFDIIIINDHNENANKARNEGLKKVSTPYVLFSDNDIDWKPDALQKLYDCLEKNSAISFAYGSYMINDKIVSNEEWNPNKLRKVNYISTMSLVRTKHHPGFDESIRRFQDWDVWLTMLHQNRIGKKVDGIIFTTPTRQGITNNSISHDDARTIILRKFSNFNLEEYKKNNNEVPVFSIITPTYNSQFIADTINSVKNQTFTSFEHIIVDDHSTDKTPSYIKNLEYPNLKFFKRPEDLPKNANSCRNYGVEQSTGDFIIFLDADDVLSPTCLEDRFNVLNTDADINIFKMGRFKNDITKEAIELVNPIEKYPNYIDNYLSYWNLWPITTMTWKREFFQKINGFDNRLSRFQDFDLHLRALLNNATIEKYPHEKIDCFYRESEFLKNMDTKKKKLILENSLYLIQKYNERNINFYKYFYDYLLKYYGDVMDNNTKDFIIKKQKISLSDPSKKLKILLLPDTPGWAFDNIACSIIKYNPYPDRISYAKKYLREIKLLKQEIDISEYDYVYLMFEGDKYVPDNKEKIIRGCYSAHWLENPINSPEYLGSKFSNNRGVVFVNNIIEKHILPFLSDDVETTIISDSSDETLFYPIPDQKQEKFTAIFVGNTERKIKNFTSIQHICEKSGINLMIAKDIPNNQLVYEYNKADICINFSDSEGGPQTFLESSLCEVPMLIKDNNSLAQKIPCFVGKTEEDFINIINHLKTNRYKCSLMGKKAREVVLKDFTYKITANKFADFFLHLKEIDEKRKVDISFIIPIRERDEYVDGLEHNIKDVFSNFSYEIIYVNQNDTKLFKRGQLCNIGFKESNGKIIIFQDVDIRHLRPINPKELLDQYNNPFVAFNEITQLEESDIGKYKLLETDKRLSGWGACAIFYREQFEQSGGFSNLIFGWGAEDNIMNERIKFKRHTQNLGHVYHTPMRTDKKTFESKWHLTNVEIWNIHHTIDKHEDGYKQTIYESNKIKKKDNIYIIDVNLIAVPENYKYLELYNKAIIEDI